MPDLVAPDDEALLLDLLNTTPVVDCDRRDLLAADGESQAWVRARRRRVGRRDRAPAPGPGPAAGRGPGRGAGRGADAVRARRACANEKCRLFLLDRSKAGTARWCSMKARGNRLEARRHYERIRRPD